jgi:hypothetical protein
LTNAIIGQIDNWYIGAVTPLSDPEILQFAQAVEPGTAAKVSVSAKNAAPGQTVTITVQVPSLPPNYETSPDPPTQPGLVPYPAASGLVTFVDTSRAGKVLGTAQLGPTGVATFTTSGLGPGLHDIEAAYSGDAVYPPAASQGISIAVGTTTQLRLLRFVEIFQEKIGQQISQPQIGRWLAALDRGVLPRTVARRIVSWVYHHTHLPPGGTIAARSSAVAQEDVNRH